METPLVLPAVIVALLAFFLLATKLSRAGRIAPMLQAMVGTLVDVRVWSAPIGVYRVKSARAFGAGLLIWLEPVAGGKATLLKVAQPQIARHAERGMAIDDARYVQWAGAKMKRVEGAPALEMTATSDVS